MVFTDLRQFLNVIDEQGDLVHIHKEVDPKYEIAAYIRQTSDTNGPALFFENVKGFGIPVVGGLFANRRRALMAMGSNHDAVTEKFLNGIKHPVSTKLLETGPCQEVVKTGKEVDLTELPIPTFSDKDSGPFITLGVVISKDPETGEKNAAIYRLELKGKDRLGIMAQQLSIQLSRAGSKNQPLEVAIAIGCATVITFATQWKAPYGVDELTVAGGISGHSVEVVKCHTVDLEVPATAEIIIEGRIPPHVTEMEGPFGEVTGYVTEASPKPIIEVTAITHRCHPIYQAALTGLPTTENHILKQIPLEATFHAELKSKFPGIKGVHFPAAGAVALMVIVSMLQYKKYEARNVIAHMFGTLRNKFIIVVDDDIDIYNMEHVMWAVTTRGQPDQDVILFPHLAGHGLDPSSVERGVNCGMGIDATRPFGQPFPEVFTIPGVEKVPDLHKLLNSQRKNINKGESLFKKTGLFRSK